MTALSTEQLQARLAERFPDLFSTEPMDPDGPMIPVDEHVDFAQFLKEELGFTLYVSVVASHWPAPPPKEDDPEAEEAEEHLEVATVLRQPVPNGLAFWWRVQIGPKESIPSLTAIFAGADWQEREQYDLVGVVFSNHPDLRRLMMPEDWDGHPLRKEYAIDTPHSPWR